MHCQTTTKQLVQGTGVFKTKQLETEWNILYLECKCRIKWKTVNKNEIKKDIVMYIYFEELSPAQKGAKTE